MDLNLREEALSHGSGDAARASPQLSGDQSRSSADDQRARGGYVLPLGGPTSGEAQVPHQQAGPEATAPDAWRGAMPPNPQFAGMPSVPAYPPSQGQAAVVKPEPTPEPPLAPAPVPLQPRPAAYSFPAGPGGSGLSGSGAMSIPPRPSSSASHGKARSNSWSYPASAVSPYAYPYSSAAGGMAAPAGARGSSQRYRYRGLSLSDDDVRQQQQLQSGPFLSAQQPQQAQQHQDQFLYGGVDQAAAFFQSSVPGQAPGTGPPTPPLPTTPSSFIRRTSLPQTYLHTIPIARPPTPMSSFAASASASIDSATFPGVPSGLQPTPPPRQEEKLEIPTHGTRALPKEIASHPAIQSITKTNPDQPTVAEAEEGEKEHGTEASPVEESGGALAPGAMHAGEGKFVDITEYLNLPQSKVAKTLGIPSSTLSKRWKEAARARKWPWRTVCKIDKEIIALLHNISPAVTAKGPDHVPPEIHSRLLTLLKQRQDELKPVIIRL